jgi:DNA-binding FadR family transcriptional regulator
VPLAVVESPRLYRQIADQLRQLIERREFPIGCRLPPERELAEKLGVSRPSVREALIALEVEGRVRIRMGSGVYVAEPARSPPPQAIAAEGPFEILEARRLVEGAICAEAADKVTPQHLAELDDILAQMAEPGLGSDRLVALDRAFHVAIAAILGNAALARCVGELFDQRMSPYFEKLARYFENDASWRAAIGEHRAVRDALAARDAAAAREAMHGHLRQSQERFSQSFGEGPVSSGAGERRRPPGAKS